MIIEVIKSIFLGIVQGISEWLPISSTGHMILVDELIALNVSADFLEMFLVVIQLASVLAVILLYFKELNPLDSSKTKDQQLETWNIWWKVAVGVIPAGVMGVLFEDLINKYFYNWLTVAIMLIVYGIAFIVIERHNKGREFPIETWQDMTYKVAFLIGCFQVLSLIPGTSRSGATIVGALLIGTARPIAAKFSFFMSIPIMFGASLLKLVGFGFSFTSTELVILLAGCIASFLVSVIAIKFLMTYIRKNDFTVFGWYRIIIGIIVILYFGFIG